MDLQKKRAKCIKQRKALILKYRKNLAKKQKQIIAKRKKIYKNHINKCRSRCNRRHCNTYFGPSSRYHYNSDFYGDYYDPIYNHHMNDGLNLPSEQIVMPTDCDISFIAPPYNSYDMSYNYLSPPPIYY